MSDTTEMLALMAKLGEIASDVKHIMSNQIKSDAAVEKLEIRLRGVEKFQWKLGGIAMVLPVVLTVGGYVIKGLIG